MIKQSLIFSLLILNACASINSLSLTPIPAQRQNQVKAEVSKFIFLGFNFNNDYIDPLTEELKAQCPNGIISGVLTKDEVISYFFAHTRKVTATGFCSSAKSGMSKHASNEAIQ